MTIKKTYSTCGMTFEKKEDAICRQAREEFIKELFDILSSDVDEEEKPTIRKFIVNFNNDIFNNAISAYLRNKEIYKDL